MYAYTWRMWHITTAKYYETQIFGKFQDGTRGMKPLRVALGK